MPLQRLATIDSLRGFLLLMMTINHLPGPHRDYTYDSIGFFTVAEGFVFVSGLISGLHGFNVFRTRGEAAMRSIFYRRARTLYVSQLILLALLSGIAVAVSVVNATCFSGPHPVWAGYALEWTNSLRPLFIDPRLASAAAVILLYQPPLFDVLPMYCLFLFFTPFFLSWIERGRAWRLLGFSFFFWLVAQSYAMNNLLAWFPARWGIQGFVFDPLAWQILFVSGSVIGGTWLKYDRKWRPGNGLLALMLVAVGIGFYVRHSPGPYAWKLFLGNASYRGVLAPARLLGSAAILACVGVWALRFPAWFTWRPLVRLGRNSLWIFLYQIALVYISGYWCDQLLTLPHGVWLDFLFIAALTSTLWITAAICERIKRWRHSPVAADQLEPDRAPGNVSR